MTELAEAPTRRIRFDPTRAVSTRDFAPALRHSRRVRILKYALPTLAVAGIGGFFLAMHFESGDSVTLSGVNVAEKSLVMKQPHISGFEGTKQAYQVNAIRAVQDLDNPTVVTLEQINGKFGLDNGAIVTVDAATGVYDAKANKLALKGGVKLVTTDGYHATLTDAAVDIGLRNMATSSPVVLEGAQGTIKANGMTLDERTKRITFVDGVSVTYLPPDTPEAPAAPVAVAAPAPAAAAPAAPAGNP